MSVKKGFRSPKTPTNDEIVRYRLAQLEARSSQIEDTMMKAQVFNEQFQKLNYKATNAIINRFKSELPIIEHKDIDQSKNYFRLTKDVYLIEEDFYVVTGIPEKSEGGAEETSNESPSNESVSGQDHGTGV